MKPAHPSTGIEYATPRRARPFSGHAIAALAIGLCSGPVMVAISALGFRVLDGTGGLLFMVVAWVVCQAAAIAFAAFIYCQLRHVAATRGRYLALAGVFAGIAWAIGIAVFVIAGINSLD